MTLAGQTISEAEDFLIFKVFDSQRSETVGGSSSNCLTIKAIIVKVLPKPISSAKIPPVSDKRNTRAISGFLIFSLMGSERRTCRILSFTPHEPFQRAILMGQQRYIQGTRSRFCIFFSGASGQRLMQILQRIQSDRNSFPFRSSSLAT